MKILLTLWGCLRSNWASQVALVVKDPPVNAGDARDEGSIPRSGRSPVGGNGDALQSSYLKKMPWTGESGGLQSAAAAAKSLQSCLTLCDPRDSSPTGSPIPGMNTGAGCHFLLQSMKVKSESEVTQSCLTPSDPMDCSPPGSSAYGIFQPRVLEWGAIAFSRATVCGVAKSRTRLRTHIRLRSNKYECLEERLANNRQ